MLPSLPNDSVRRIISAALDAADPSDSICSALTQRANQIASGERVFLLSVGKAGEPMAEAALPLLDDKLADGLIITKCASRGTLGRLAVIEAGHPLPDARSLEAGRRVQELLSRLTRRDWLLCLFSGGASALMSVPVDGVSLEDLQNITSRLLSGGAGIDELNLVRKRLDQLKGGGLAQRVNGARVLSLILSDVVGDRMDLIASGPTVPDSSTREQIEQTVVRYQLASHLPPAVLAALRRDIHADISDRVQNIIVGSGAQAAYAAREQAVREGFRARVITTRLQGEARRAGTRLAGMLRRARTRPLCFIAAGETTVTVTGQGRGGRNQELALAAALELDGLRNVMLLSFATDGDDGTTGAAGAVVTGETLSRARTLGLDALDFLRRNDSHTFFAALGNLIIGEPTGTNVNDLVLLLKF